MWSGALLLLWALLGLLAARADVLPDVPSPALLRLVRQLPAPGAIRDYRDLGITIGALERPPRPVPDGFNFLVPADLDNRSTDGPPYRGQFPGLHLNLPLHVRRSDVNYLFLSDQPEFVYDTRKREDGSTGATGIYAEAEIPAAAPTRLLLDHSDGTKRPLRLYLVFVPRVDGAMMVLRRGELAQVDSVLAGRRSMEDVLRPALEPRAALHREVPFVLVDVLMQPTETAVAQLEFAATAPGRLYTVVAEASAAPPATRAQVEALPILHSIVWIEEEARFRKFVSPKLQPTRYQRLLHAFQHARGRFHFPDRVAGGAYDVRSWRSHPVQAYSLFESIPGWDPTVDYGVGVNNRGRYGSHTFLRLRFRALPPGCTKAALLVLNPDGTHGGVDYATDGRRRADQTVMAPGLGPGPLHGGEAVTLWEGPVHIGGVIEMSTVPMANLSVQLWYVVVPIPGDSAPFGGGTRSAAYHPPQGRI